MRHPGQGRMRPCRLSNTRAAARAGARERIWPSRSSSCWAVLARDLRPDVAAVVELELDADLEAEVHDALDERLGAGAVGLGEDLDVVRAHERVAEAVDGPDERHHELVGGVSYSSRGAPACSIAALVHDDDLLGDFHRLLLIVRDEDRRHVDLLVQAAQPFAQLGAHLRVERAEGLVEQQHLRLHGQRARERHALQLSAGELGGVALGEAVEAHEREQLLDALADLVPSGACAR